MIKQIMNSTKIMNTKIEQPASNYIKESSRATASSNRAAATNSVSASASAVISLKERLPEYLIWAAGVFLRLLYVLNSTIYDRQYDVGMIDLAAGHTVSGGHLAYIQFLYENGHLPDMDPTLVYQFNHPPFHYTISALWLRLASCFIGNTAQLEESLQMIPFLCSLALMVVLAKLLRIFEIKSSARCFAAAVFAFHPALILLSGSVNNDCMGLLFSALCFFEAVMWYKAVMGNSSDFSGGGSIEKRSAWRHIICLAISMGLGIMTKQSVAIMAFPVGILFLYMMILVLPEWHKPYKQETEAPCDTAVSSHTTWITLSELVRQYVIFLIISVPLAMWFYIRNSVRYGTPLVWVYTLPEDSWQYTGNASVVNRLLWPNISEFAANLRKFQIGCGYNVWLQVMRTSVLGEWDMANVSRSIKVAALLLMLAGGALGVITTALMISEIILGSKETLSNLRMRHFIKFQMKKKEANSLDVVRYNSKENTGYNSEESIRYTSKENNAAVMNWFSFGAYVIHMLFFLKFAYDYPQECSMNFRYITFCLIPPVLAAARYLQREESSRTGRKVIKHFIYTMTVLFCLLSVIMVIVWCFE